jgi:predicted nucleic acid-binding protein
MLVLLDSNILLRWLEPADPDSGLVVAAVERLLLNSDSLCYTSQNLGEFWNVLTRPASRNGYGLTAAQAHLRARSIESRIELLPDTPAVHLEWRRLLVAHDVCGSQVHDARLAAAMHIHGVKRILTFNTRDFARFADVESTHPARLATP